MSGDTRSVLTDRELLRHARAGNAQATNQLLDGVRQVVLRYCRSRLATYDAGREVAEDVAQEVCLAVVNALPRYQDNGAPFAALVFAIAANKVADAQRRYARTPVQLVEELPERVHTDGGPELQVMLRSDVEAVLTLIDRLPERTAQVIRLRAEGRDANEVGEILGMTANAVRVLQHRGLARLRQLIASSADCADRFAGRPGQPLAS